MNIRKILTALVEFAALCAVAETARATKHTENKKIKNLSKVMLAVLAIGLLFVLFSQQAQATAINGNINFAAAVQFDTNSLATATQVTTWFDIFNNAGFSNVAPGSTGHFGGIPAGTQATIANPGYSIRRRPLSRSVECWWFHLRSALGDCRDSECNIP
jgi:hypothetical protein